MPELSDSVSGVTLGPDIGVGSLTAYLRQSLTLIAIAMNPIKLTISHRINSIAFGDCITLSSVKRLSLFCIAFWPSIRAQP